MKYLILLLLITVSFLSHASEFNTIKILDGKVTILAPKTFSPMPDNMIEIKYPNSRRPTEVLSNETGSVTLAFGHTKIPMRPDQITEVHQLISKGFHNMYPSATWLRDDIIEQNGSKFIVLELITPALDSQIHNIMYGTSVNDHFLMVSFNTTVKQSEEWLPIGRQIMASLTVK